MRRAQRLTPIVSIQNRYNVADRRSESLVELCEQEQMVFLPWAPIQNLNRNRILPIPGTGSMSHLEGHVAAAAIKLAPADVAP